jgi:hypothetical protein
VRDILGRVTGARYRRELVLATELDDASNALGMRSSADIVAGKWSVLFTTPDGRHLRRMDGITRGAVMAVVVALQAVEAAGDLDARDVPAGEGKS